MTDPVIDMAVVQELLDISGDDDPELLIDLIDMFLDDAPQKVQAIVDGIGTGDLEAVERAAHSLKGSSGNLGAVQVQELAETLQLAGRERNAEAVQIAIDPLHHSYRAAEQALRDIRGRYGH